MSASQSVALHGAPVAKGSLFCYKNLQTPHFAPKNKKIKNILGSIFGRFSPSSLSNFSPKHIQTHQNTLDSHIFSTIFKVVLLHLIFLSLVPYLGFEVQGYGCSFLATIHTLFSLQLFLASFCIIKCFICFSWHVLASQHVL